MDGVGPIRGGIPIAFPQFADTGPLRLHGFARDGLWALAEVMRSDTGVRAVFERADDEKTRALWNFHSCFGTLCTSKTLILR